MALTCARCGTQNPDGNRFCTGCGTALVPAAAPVPAAPVAVGAGAGYAAPAMAQAAAAAPPPAYAPQPGYQSPYYAPAPGAPPPAIHRTPWMLIISVVVGVVLVLGGLGTVLALTLGKHNTQGSSFSAVTSPSPASSPASSPSAGTASPSPTSQPSPPGQGQTVTTSTVSVVVPSGWEVANKDDNSVTLQNADGTGSLTIASGQSSPPQTAQQLKDSIDKSLATRFPDAAECPNSKSDTGAIAGEDGIFWMMCFTATSGGQSLSIAEPIWVGANASGSVAYVVVLQTTQDNIDAFVQQAAPILQSGITWELK